MLLKIFKLDILLLDFI